MPENAGGPPSPDGERPESRENGAADEAFAAVVLDDAFIEAARIHEPTAEERMLYAALERAEAEAAQAAAAADAEAADGSSPEDGPEFWIEIAGEPVAFDGTPEEGQDDEGRFDSSDYTRYLPDGPDHPSREVSPGRADQGETASPEENGCRHRGGSRGTGVPRRAADSGRSARRAPGRPSGRIPRPRTVSGPHPAPEPLGAGRPGRWQRPVACVLAVVMGLSVVAFAVVSVQRAGSAQRALPAQQPPVPPVRPGTSQTGGTAQLPPAPNGGGEAPPASGPASGPAGPS